MTLSSLKKWLSFDGNSKQMDKKFWELAAENERLLYNAALKYTGNRFDAEDLFQESLYVAHRNFHQLRDKRKFKSWLFTILRNIYLKSQRYKKRLMYTSEEIDTTYLNYAEAASKQSDIETVVEQKVESEKIQKLIADLPEKYKSVLILYYMADYTYQEISQTLDIPIGTIMSRLSRGKNMLKKKILQLRLKETVPAKIIQLSQKV